MIQSVSMRNAGTLEAGFRAGHQEATLFDTPLELVGIDQALPATRGLFEPSEPRSRRKWLDPNDDFVAFIKARVLERLKHPVCEACTNRSAHHMLSTPRSIPG